MSREPTTSGTMISVIIPVYNEAAGLKAFLRALKSALEPQANAIPHEIILVDGGSSDATIDIACQDGFRCVSSPRKGRAAQMNHGSGLASGTYLYFLHADTVPPPNALSQIMQAAGEGALSGCFRLSFDEPGWLMRFYAWFTRFDLLPFRYGDQSMFVRTDLFHDLGGFREDHMVMEDNEMFRRLRKRGQFVILDDAVVTSARTYRKNGFLRLQFIFFMIFTMYYLGVRQETLVDFYRSMISSSKL